MTKLTKDECERLLGHCWPRPSSIAMVTTGGFGNAPMNETRTCNHCEHKQVKIQPPAEWQDAEPAKSSEVPA